MGLAIGVGDLADAIKNDPEAADCFKEEFATLNEVLKAENLPVHDEPTELPQISSRSDYDGFPYSFMHYLRRFYARSINNADWIPIPVKEGEEPAEDEVLDEQASMCESHLLCHSDCEGYYLPLDFDDVLISDDHEIPGGLLCSSYQLMKELIAIAPKLGIKIVDGKLSDVEASTINQEVSEQKGGFWIEKLVWLSLFEAARLSIEYKSAIHFG